MNTAPTAPVTTQFTHRAMLEGATLLFDISESQELQEFIEKQVKLGANPATLRIESLDSPIAKILPVTTQPAAPSVPRETNEELTVGQYDAAGDARSQRDREAAIAAGFAPAAPVYRQGLRAEGMKTHRAKFDKLPLAADAAVALRNTVLAESRQDVEVERSAVALDDEGCMVLPAAQRLQMNDRAFKSLVGRLNMPNGAGAYLAGIRTPMRALNLNDWVTR